MKKLVYILPCLIFIVLIIYSCNKNDTASPTGGTGSGPQTSTFNSSPSLNKFITNGYTFDTITTNISLNINAQNVSDIKLRLGDIQGVDVTKLKFSLVHGSTEVFVIDTLTNAGSSFINTVLSDSAVNNINNGTSPYTGTFKPQNPLSDFINANPSGDWVLKIYNYGVLKTGVIKSWSITITYSPSIQLPVLDSRYLPMLGDIRKFTMSDTNNVNPGPAGENVTWDFTYLIEHPFEYTEEFVEPIISPIFWRFSQSNLAIRNFDLYQEMLTFLNVNPNTNTFLYYGEGDSNMIRRRYRLFTNPIPLVNGSNIIYNYNTINSGKTSTENYLNPSSTSSGNYQDSVSGDAWGTLKLPGVTYNNVLREKIIINTQDTVNGNQNYYTSMKIYDWYQTGYKFPVFRIQYYLQFNVASGYRGWKQVEKTTQNVPINK